MSIRRLLLTVLVVSTTAMLSVSCADTGADGWQPPRIVRIEGAKAVYSLSPMYGTFFGGAVQRTDQGDEPLTAVEGATYVLVRDGELVSFMEGMPFPYAAADGTTLSVETDEGRAVLAGTTVAVKLGEKDEQGWTWLREASDKDLAALRLVQVASLVPSQEADEPPDEAAVAARREALGRLAKANPRVGVVLEDRSATQPVLEALDPPWLSVGDAALTEADRALLAAEPALHTLTMGGGERKDLGFLSRLGGLRTLSISDWKGPEEDKPPAALPTIPSLRTLIVFGTKMTDLAPVGKQPGLKELVIVRAEALDDLEGLSGLPGLRALSLQNCPAVKDLSALSGLKGLRWLALPPGTTQEQFQRVCREHPDLVVLQAVPCNAITDLAPLARLRGLRVLSVCEVKAPLDPLADMKSLRLLGVGLTFPDKKEGEEEGPKEGAEDKAQKPRDEEDKGPEPVEVALVRIMEANPDLAVVEVSPLCLGSGWILALAPLAAGAWWLARRRRRHAADADDA